MQPQYRAYAQQVPQRSPHATNQRRGGIGKFSKLAAYSIRLILPQLIYLLTLPFAQDL